MKTNIEFRKLSFTELEAAARQHSATAYVGGSNQGRIRDFRKYIASKKVKPHAALCGWARTTNAKAAENKLLVACKEACPLNTQRRSNVRPSPGFVYLLL